VVVTQLGNGAYQGFSSDVKPISGVTLHSRFNELNTANVFELVSGTPSGIGWVLTGQTRNIITVAPDGTGNYTNLQAALNAITSGVPTKIIMAPGNYNHSGVITVGNHSNLSIQGAGQGVTNLIAGTNMQSGDGLFFNCFGISLPASSGALRVNTTRGDTSVTVTPTVSNSYSGGDYLMVTSNKQVDSDSPDFHAGEILQVSGVTYGTGLIAFKDQVNEAYTTGDAAFIIKLNLNQNITVSDMTITSNATSGAALQGFVDFRLNQNLNLHDMEISNGHWVGLHVESCINSVINSVFIHDTKDTTPASNTREALGIHSACKSIVIDSCQFSNAQHGIAMEGHPVTAGENFEGVPRNITVNNCTSVACDTAHFNTEQPCENVVFSACTALGGVAASGTSGVFGYQIKSAKTSLIGCKSITAKGKAINITKAAAAVLINGCTIDNCKQFSGAGGDGIFLDVNVNGATMVGNHIKDCEGHALTNLSGNANIIFNSNYVGNCCTVVTGDGNIKLNGSSSVTIVGNQFQSGVSSPIQIAVTGTQYNILGNNFVTMQSTTPTLLGVTHVVMNNQGHNPIGSINQPWASGVGTSGNLTNSPDISNTPESGSVYTNRYTPKMVLISGGSGVNVAINGFTIPFSGGQINLGIGDSIQFNYQVAPMAKVFGE
jgi:hypothetical protein